MPRPYESKRIACRNFAPIICFRFWFVEAAAEVCSAALMCSSAPTHTNDSLYLVLFDPLCSLSVPCSLPRCVARRRSPVLHVFFCFQRGIHHIFSLRFGIGMFSWKSGIRMGLRSERSRYSLSFACSRRNLARRLNMSILLFDFRGGFHRSALIASAYTRSERCQQKARFFFALVRCSPHPSNATRQSLFASLNSISHSRHRIACIDYWVSILIGCMLLADVVGAF